MQAHFLHFDASLDYLANGGKSRIFDAVSGIDETLYDEGVLMKRAREALDKDAGGKPALRERRWTLLLQH